MKGLAVKRNNSHIENANIEIKSGEVFFAINDPRLNEEQRKFLYDLGTKLYGTPNWKLEKISSGNLFDIDRAIIELKDRLQKARDVEKRANVIFYALRDDSITPYDLDQLIKINPIDSDTLIHIVNKAIKLDISEKAKLRVKKKLQNDPKQIEKQFIFNCWQQWQKQPDRYKGKAAFARDMLPKCEHLTSQKKIEDWCREWEKSHPAGVAS